MKFEHEKEVVENSNLEMIECLVTSQSSSSEVSSPAPPPSNLDRLDLEPSEVSSRKESMPSASDMNFIHSLHRCNAFGLT